MYINKLKIFKTFKKCEYKLLLNIQQHSLLILKINKYIDCLLPDNLRNFYKVSNVDTTKLVLEVANASYKMRLFQENEKLINNIRYCFIPSLSKIIININPELICNSILINKRNRIRFLSTKSANYINNISKHCNKRLKLTLFRLIKLSS